MRTNDTRRARGLQLKRGFYDYLFRYYKNDAKTRARMKYADADTLLLIYQTTRDACAAFNDSNAPAPDWRPVYNSKLYNANGGAYCQYLEYINELIRAENARAAA